MSTIPYEAMNASEKTKYIGFKVFSDREMKDRTKKADARRSDATKKFLTDLLANPNVAFGSKMSEQEIEVVYKDVLNNFYDQAVKDGITTKDLEEVMNNLIAIAYVFKRVLLEPQTESMRLTFALTGENSIGDVPIREVIAISKVAAEMRPIQPSEYDGEPSQGQMADEGIKDVVTEEAK